MPNHQRPATPEEQRITEALDALYPKARTRTVVEYEGKKYQLRYFPIAKDEDGGKVKEWGHHWVEI
jgi:hypothetical protein